MSVKYENRLHISSTAVLSMLFVGFFLDVFPALEGSGFAGILNFLEKLRNLIKTQYNPP